MASKQARVELHSFNSLPAHYSVSGRGQAGNAALAVGRAIRNALQNPTLKGKRFQSFKCNVTVMAEASKVDPA